MTRIFGLVLIVLFPMTVLAAKKNMLVRFNYSEKGELVCEGEEQMLSGDRYQLCEGQVGDRKVVVRAKAVANQDGNISLEADIDHIAADGKLTQTSRPGIMALDGETASIAVTAEGQPSVDVFRLEVTPSILRQ